MNIRRLSGKFNSTLQGVTTLVVALCLLHLMQSLAHEIIQDFEISRRRSSARSKQGSSTQELSKVDRIVRSDKRFLADGTMHYVYSPSSPRNQEEEEQLIQIYDVNDHLIWSGPGKPVPDTYLSWAQSNSWRHYRRFEGFSQDAIGRVYTVTPEFSRTLDVPIIRDKKTQATWRYDLGHHHFAGYSSTGARLGFLGANGLVSKPSDSHALGEPVVAVAWCPRKTYDPMMLWMTASKLYQIDFAKQDVTCLFESSQSPLTDLTLQAWLDLEPKEHVYEDPNRHPPLLCCTALDGTYYFVYKNGTRKVTLKPPAEWGTKVSNYYQFSSTPEGLFFCRDYTDFNAPPDYDSRELDKWIEQYRQHDKTQWKELYTIDLKGQLDLVSRFSWTQPKISGVAYHAADAGLYKLINMPSPLAYTFMGYFPYYQNIMRALFNRDIYRPTLISQLVRTIAFRAPDLIYGGIMSAAMTAIVLWHGMARQRSKTSLVAWVLFTALFNLAGFLTYMAFNHTATVKCTHCGKRRGLDRDACPRCGMPLPQPVHNKPQLIMNQAQLSEAST